jgi:hypothetical protein
LFVSTLADTIKFVEKDFIYIWISKGFAKYNRPSNRLEEIARAVDEEEEEKDRE